MLTVFPFAVTVAGIYDADSCLDFLMLCTDFVHFSQCMLFYSCD